MDIDDKQHYAKKAVIIIEQQEKRNPNVTGRSENVWHRSVTLAKMAGVSVGTVSRYFESVSN